MKSLSIPTLLLVLVSIRTANTTIVPRHCECQSPLSKLQGLSGADVDALLSGTLTWPKDNGTTSSCCSEADPPGKVNGAGDMFENVCSVQKDLVAGTGNAAYKFLICCIEKGMLAECYD
ncbi:hypothetical protein UCDDA912_g06258 [Diaporthe ampelina]|uniref:Uncharacterized protein n=1 Tax=Diaporthe ampelina TaxID=1214573 RepID=A0A0G2I100_9PEZI|nr:hypothetical protein UCDDA912_g06258 [Diaporthe ampelina]